MWVLTVAWLTTSVAAISALERPAAISLRTSASRGVRLSGSVWLVLSERGWGSRIAVTSRCCVGGEHENLGVGEAGADSAGRLDAVDFGHAQVHEHDVRAFVERELDRLEAV